MPKARHIMELQGRTRVVVENYGGHEDTVLDKSVSLIGDCDAVLCSRIGGGASEGLLSRGIEPVEAPGFIEENVLAYARYRLKDSHA